VKVPFVSVFYQLISVQSDQNFSFVSFILFARASPIIYFVISLIKFRLASETLEAQKPTRTIVENLILFAIKKTLILDEIFFCVIGLI
jgi:hypothetical protein